MTSRQLIFELYGDEPFVMPENPATFLKSLQMNDKTYWRNFLVSLELPSHTKLSHYSLDMLARMADLADFAESLKPEDTPKLYKEDP
jgi:hypothetical protein